VSDISNTAVELKTTTKNKGGGRGGGGEEIEKKN